MALHFHQLTVKKIEKLTHDAVGVTFDIPESLKHEFTFKQGQNITIKKTLNGEEVRRSYSICSSPFDNELKVGIKKAFNGLFSSYANSQLKAGDVLEVMPPSGKFYTELSSLSKKNYMAFAAGSGITPVFSIIKTTLQTESHSGFTLVYGNQNYSSIMFKEELAGLKNIYPERFALHHILSKEKTETAINYGRIDEVKCLALAKFINFKVIDEFFICGPETMIFTIKDSLKNYGIKKDKIHFELFTTPANRHLTLNKFDALKEPDNSSQITVKLDGRSFDFNLDYNSNTILDAALAEGADLPFSCKGGVCTTCKAKLIDGKIEMEVNYGLEADEVDKGFILTCQSHPRSKKVMVDFDVK